MSRVVSRTSGQALRKEQQQDSISGAITSLGSFDFQLRTRMIFGIGVVERVGELARELGARKVLLVTDRGIVAAGHAERVREILGKAKLKTAVYDAVQENPTTRDVAECVAAAKAAKIDFLVGLGGGSAMDTAKACNFILTNGGRMQDYWGVGKAKKPMLPMIAIPTTSGTGSEMQSAALISDEVTHTKMACLDHKAAAKIAILDPALTLSQPRAVTACTGIDAIAHALESGVTTKRTPLSAMFSQTAFRLCFQSFSEVLRNPENLQARGEMLLGAAFAGLAIENSMLGAAHAAANPLTAHFGVVHGRAVGLMLPHVVRFNGVAVASEYETLTSLKMPALVKALRGFLKEANLPENLGAVGVKRSKLLTLAEEAAQQWTGTFNPRPVGKMEFARFYEAAF